ncbi:hypothetical protein STVA_53530 [Allostella vacuolata]|nr:hypothetical protein STVA_53530 [Stella vacuolata]
MTFSRLRRGVVPAICIVSWLAASGLGAGPAVAQTPVDTALVLAVDSSGSIDEAEFRLQRDGIATALTSPRVLSAIAGGAVGRIAVAYVEWGSPARAETVVGWHVVGDRAAADALAAAIVAASRSRQSYNAIGDAIDHAAGLFAACGCEATRRVIDISGDNADMRSVRPAAAARDAAVAAGITVNALAILGDDRPGPGGRPWLVEYYERAVIGGAGAFVMAARDRADFTRALLDKMVLEIAGRPLPDASLAAARRP